MTRENGKKSNRNAFVYAFLNELGIDTKHLTPKKAWEIYEKHADSDPDNRDKVDDVQAVKSGRRNSGENLESSKLLYDNRDTKEYNEQTINFLLGR